MRNEEINRYLHTEIMGRHWHEWKPARGANKDCDCGVRLQVGINSNPDYCSDESPRSLLNGVVARVIPKNADRMAFIVNGICPVLMQFNLDSNIHAIELNAEQIARACVEAWQAK